jgi:predicted RNA-binding protein associated with RNAse of E/G family
MAKIPYMKRKFADRPDWKRIIKKTYKQIFIQEKNYEGHVSYLLLEQVRNPLHVKYENADLCIVDNGFVWMQHFPKNMNYVLTSTYDSSGKAVQWYFDIVKSVGTTDHGIPYCDDLFLDVVALPGGKVYLLDEDELQEALRRNLINEGEFHLAYDAANRLMKELRENNNYIIHSNLKYYQFMSSLNP